MMKTLRKPSVWALGLLPILLHFILLGKYAINFPLKDDYRVFVSYLYHYLQSPDKWAALALPENESRPIVMRLSVLAQFFIDGALNFKHLLIFCNVSLVVFLGCISLHFYKKKEFLALSFACLLFLNPLLYEMYFRNDVGTYQLASFSLAIFLFYGATNYQSAPKWLRCLFLLGFMLTPLGSINGFIASTLIILYFFLEKKRMAFVLLVILIFQLYLVLGGDSKSAGILENIMKYNYQLLYAYFLSLGGILVFIQHSFIWPIVAISMIIVLGYVIWKMFYPWKWRLDFEKMVFLFSIASLGLIVILRYNYWITGYPSVLESRYKIYGAFPLLMFFVIVGRRWGKKAYLSTAVCLVLLYAAGFYKGKQQLELLHQEKITEAYNVYHDSYELEFARAFFVNEEKRRYLEEHGFYSFKEADKILKKALREENRLKPIAHQWRVLSEDPGSDGDWAGFPVPMSNFELRGEFPKKKYYFVKFYGEKTCVQFLLPGVKPFWASSQETVRKLSRDFYADAYSGVDFENFEVYGVDDL